MLKRAGDRVHKNSSGQSDGSAGENQKIPQIRFAAATTGRFDIVVRIEASDIRELGEILVKGIQRISDVTYTETSLIVAT